MVFRSVEKLRPVLGVAWVLMTSGGMAFELIEDKEACDAFSGLAFNAMAFRQAGIPVDKQVKDSARHNDEEWFLDLVRSLGERAYDAPQEDTEEERLEAIENFEQMIRNEICAPEVR